MTEGCSSWLGPSQQGNFQLGPVLEGDEDGQGCSNKEGCNNALLLPEEAHQEGQERGLGLVGLGSQGGLGLGGAKRKSLNVTE